LNDDNLQAKPIFFDPTQRRYSVLSVLAAILTFFATIGALVFLISIALTPRLHNGQISPSGLSAPLIIRTATHPGHANAAGRARTGDANVDATIRQMDKFVLRHDRNVQEAKTRLTDAIRREAATVPIPTGSILPGSVKGPVRAVFFQNDEDKDGIDSLEHHIQNTTHLMPIWMQLDDNGRDVEITQDLSANDQGPVGLTYDDIAIGLAQKYGVAILPVLQNAGDGSFPTTWVHNLVNSPKARHAIIEKALNFVEGNHYQGINLDLETDQAADRIGMTAFVNELAAAFHAHNLLVTQDIQLDSGAYALPALARADDFLVPMLYDEHADGSAPGPIAAQGWYERELMDFLAQVPANRVVIGIGNYAYDWKKGSTSAVSMSFEEACQTAEDSKDGQDGIISIDPNSLNPYFTYYDDSNGQGDDEIPHEVWLEDATTAYNQMRLASNYHPLGAALWRVGTEDPSLWSFFNRSGDAALNGFNPQALSDVTYNYFGTSFRGQGDVLDVVQAPTPGHRTVAFDSTRNVITGESFQTYPSQWVIRRTGLVDQVTGENTSKKIALTFDDGPDPRWTPQILDILQRYHVPATFFVVGENAEAHPGLLEREWNMGMEIGNHSFTHPEIDSISPIRTRLELDACQRVIEAMTGHMTTLFRAPNRADSEPTTQQDFEPILDAHNMDYLFIGEQIDPTDWYPGIKADQIVNTVLNNPDKGNCVLLHDAGGDTREETVKALPRIIEGLKAKGYTFVPVSKLIYPNLSAAAARNAVFPAVTGSQRWTVAYDRAFFYITFGIGKFLGALFLIAICLGIFRIVFMGVLAAIQSRSEKRRTFDPAFQPAVSVVIAAYNEAKVINRTIATLLRSEYPDLEIVVVDDGSQDDTAATVRAEYGGHPRVMVLQKPNGGKASALNLGIKECRGEVIVALDADTVFAPDTISKLVRHFNDPDIGAVSGNVKVGNRNNAWTIWQAVEYITSQNFDRRSFDLLNCITVVPGAVGAWRRDAIVLAGLYSPQTLAEDTDLTFKVRKLGYRIRTDNEAYAYTEAPENLRNLAKQRFRWAFGTLQCLWKHRDALLRPRYGAFGFFAMPSLWIFQIGFQAIAPIVDLGILWTWIYGRFIAPQTDHNGLIMLLGYWALFTTIEMLGALLAFKLDGEDIRLIPWLPLQRFAYRQLMYYVILKSIRYALVGKRVGWGKFERKGTVKAPSTERTSNAPDTVRATEGPVEIDKNDQEVTSRP
jgi:cellulose synthase/poly-beta-1,6-N-acetylglucosamine synthase-like glycosyltransferase/peptidoglycan/xylan/chitin deacetylase (PgdA/CDA1 family)/spore germination protein YaaH